MNASKLCGETSSITWRHTDMHSDHEPDEKRLVIVPAQVANVRSDVGKCNDDDNENPLAGLTGERVNGADASDLSPDSACIAERGPRIAAIVLMLMLPLSVASRLPASSMSAEANACLLLTTKDIERVTGNSLQSRGGHDETPGLSTCTWSSSDGMHLLTATVTREPAFRASGQTAAEAFTRMSTSMSRAGFRVRPVDGFVGSACTVRTGPPDGRYDTVLFVHGRHLVELVASGFSSSDALRIARQVAGRLQME